MFGPSSKNREKGTRRERSRGYVLVVLALIGLVAELISTVQDGIGAPKLIVLACFGFLFWYGWELAHPAPPEPGQ